MLIIYEAFAVIAIICILVVAFSLSGDRAEKIDDPQTMTSYPLQSIPHYGSAQSVQRMQQDIIAAGFQLDGYNVINQQGQMLYAAEPLANGMNIWRLSDNEQNYTLVGKVPKREYYAYLLNHENLLMIDPQQWRIF